MSQQKPTKHYLGISIGPVVDTLLTARKTRELWTASYLFSTLMRELVAVCQQKGLTVLSPIAPATYPAPTSAPPLQVSVPLQPYEVFGAGVYPDRLYAVYEWETTPSATDLSKLEEKVKKRAIEKVATLARAGNKLSRSKQAVVTEFYQQFFRIVTVWLADTELIAESAPPVEEGEIVQTVEPNVLFNLNALLDSLELQPAYLDDDKAGKKNNQLTKLLNTPYSAKLVRDGLARNPNGATTEAYHGLTNPRGWTFSHFPSTGHIASLGLFQDSESDYRELQEGLAREQTLRPADWMEATSEAEVAEGLDTDAAASSEVLREFYRLLEGGPPLENFTGDYSNNLTALKPQFRDFHKYFCVVHADGDQFGKVIESLKTDAEISEFSGQLGNYATAAARMVNDYGGKAIYIGGDDLLFLAPVVCCQKSTSTEVTVFDLIDALDGLFLSYAENWSFTPSLSYGVTISHYKYPLFEAVPGTYDLLTQKAKKIAWPKKGTKKNAVHFRLVRHSGSYFEGYLSKQLLKRFNNLRNLRTKQDFLSSFTFKLRELEPLLEAMGGSLNQTRMTYLIGNFFNESIHENQRDNLAELVSFYQAVLETKATRNDKLLSSVENVYALLRLMTFTLAKSASSTTATPNHVLA